MRLIRPAVGLSLSLLVTACASFTPDGGMAVVATTVRDQVGAEATKITSESDAAVVAARVALLLRNPLSADSAVQIALLNNRILQAAYNDLGLAEIASVEAGLPPNPKLSLSRISGPSFVEWEFRLLGNILALTTLPARKEIAGLRFDQAQKAAIAATYRIALDTRQAWLAAVAARETVGYLEQARAAADATADLMRKLGETGGATKLEQARAGAAYAEIGVQLAQARLRERQTKDALTRVMGLWGEALDIRIPSRLPPLPRTVDRTINVETEALENRMDLKMARQELAIAARSLKLSETTRFVSLLELAGIGKNERDSEGTTNRGGLELEIEFPIFDGGEVKSRREIETYMRAVNRLAAQAVNARSESRTAYGNLLATHEIAAQYQNRVLPLRRIVAQETLLQYNGMLIDVFDLLTEARERVFVNIAAIAARKSFFQAEIELRAAVIGGGSGSPGEAPEATPSAPAGAPGH